jgi:DNA polymerase III delta subunit
MREEENISVADIKLQLRLHPFFAKDFFTNLQKFTLAELSASLSKIQRADLALKSSGRPEVAILQGLLISVLSPSTSPLQAR